MSLAEKLRAHKIYNTHDLIVKFAAKGQDVCCMYVTRDARACRPPCTRVYSPSHKTDPKAHWACNGQKTFVGNRIDSLAKAIAWTSEAYQILDWSPCPFDRSARIPKAVRDAAELFCE